MAQRLGLDAAEGLAEVVLIGVLRVAGREGNIARIIPVADIKGVASILVA
jgi:hypothetical protein